MAHPDTSLSRLGAVNGGATTDELFLKQFGGEILTEFEKATVFKDKHFVRQIRNGKSAQFPMIGPCAPLDAYPGNFIDGQVVNHVEMVISVDLPTGSPRVHRVYRRADEPLPVRGP